MQPKPASLPPRQLPLPLEMDLRTNPSPPPTRAESAEEERTESRCVPRKTWRTLSPTGRERLRRTWLRVLKEVVDDDA